MSDAVGENSRAQPLAGRRVRSADGGLEMGPAPTAARFALRCRPAHVAHLGSTFGVPLPVAACRAAMAGDRAALWLGPDEWLLLAADGAQAAIQDAFAAQCTGLSFSLVDISQQTVGLVLDGSAARDALSLGCPLDLDATVFPPGSCTRTVFSKCEIILWRSSAQTFRMELLRSYADYAWRLLGLAFADRAGDEEAIGCAVEAQDRAACLSMN